MATKGFSVDFDSQGIQWQKDHNEKNPRWYYFEPNSTTPIRVYTIPEWEQNDPRSSR